MPKKILDSMERLHRDGRDRWRPCGAANTAVQPRDTPGSGKSRSLAEKGPREHPYDGEGVSQGIAPGLRRGAKAMDDLFKAHQEASEPPNLPPAVNENQTER